MQICPWTVTAERYAVCWGGAPSVADEDGGGWGPNTGRQGRERHPVNGVQRDQASASCACLGGRLPSEAEWEYAATGPAPRVYPWGDGPDPGCAQVLSWRSEGDCPRPGTVEVGSVPRGASAFGLMDMIGNVSEWVEDCYDAGYQGAPVDGTARVVCQDSRGVVRGEPSGESPWSVRVAYRRPVAPAFRSVLIGVRCARDLP